METGRRVARYINREEEAERNRTEPELKRQGFNYKVLKHSKDLTLARNQALHSSLILARRSKGVVALLLKILAFRSFQSSHEIKIMVVDLVFLKEPDTFATLDHQSRIFVQGDQVEGCGLSVPVQSAINFLI